MRPQFKATALLKRHPIFFSFRKSIINDFRLFYFILMRYREMDFLQPHVSSFTRSIMIQKICMKKLVAV
jgi:hypothetical protein